MDGRRIQLGLADLALADALSSVCVLDIEAREDTRLLLCTLLLILAELSLVAASDLSKRLATKVFHVDLVPELGHELVSLSAMEHELSTRV